MGKLKEITDRKYRVAEIKRLKSEGLTIGRIAKALKIPYSLAKTLETLTNKEA